MKKNLFLPALLAAYFLLVFLLVSFGHKKYDQPVNEDRADSSPDVQYKKAYFSGGCFWCVEANYEQVYGVIEAISGYSGGHIKNPTYRQVASGGSGHIEAVEVIYDPEKVSYNELLNELWYVIDPTDAGGSFYDRGGQYRSAIFYLSEKEKLQAEQSIRRLEQSFRYSKPIVTEVIAFRNFYKAEKKHQNYYKKNPLRYNYYRYLSGRDQYLERIWGADLSDR